MALELAEGRSEEAVVEASDGDGVADALLLIVNSNESLEKAEVWFFEKGSIFGCRIPTRKYSKTSLIYRFNNSLSIYILHAEFGQAEDFQNDPSKIGGMGSFSRMQTNF